MEVLHRLRKVGRILFSISERLMFYNDCATSIEGGIKNSNSIS